MDAYRIKKLEAQRKSAALVIAVLFHLGLLAGVWYASSSQPEEENAGVEKKAGHHAVARVKKV